MIGNMLPTAHNQDELLASAHERARWLCETLARQEADLSASQSPTDASIREEGLAALRRAMECAARLAMRTQRLTQRPVTTNEPTAEEPPDE